jgi:hypothetical protein
VERARIIVAMSGGVDSSVAALRLLEAGHEVVGVTLHLWDYPDESDHGRCCAPEDQYDARRVADHLGFPHYTFDRRELFQRVVVDPFVDAYLEGRTPQPLRGLQPRREAPAAAAAGGSPRGLPRGDGALRPGGRAERQTDPSPWA